MTDYDSSGAKYGEDDVRFITPDLPPEAQIHVHHLAVIRLGKAALVAALDAGAVLREERNRRGADFGDWVDTQLGLSRSEAECYIRFYEKSGLRTEQLSPAVEVKLPRVLELLGQLNAAVPPRVGPVRPTPEAGKTNGDATKPVDSSGVRDTCAERTVDADELAKVRARKRTSAGAVKTAPVQQDRDDRRSALTTEQEQLLMRRSPKLFMQLRMGDVHPDEALRLANDLPDRLGPQRT